MRDPRKRRWTINRGEQARIVKVTPEGNAIIEFSDETRAELQKAPRCSAGGSADT
jgi:hypothetical protein